MVFQRGGDCDDSKIQILNPMTSPSQVDLTLAALPLVTSLSDLARFDPHAAMILSDSAGYVSSGKGRQEIQMLNLFC